ncbi:transcriptional regulator, TetR family [Paenibacillaceae bacterium GAS479]|nr:transcriptional regulator, TetR family [Paenibacillaceae bacterium GAS479]
MSDKTIHSTLQLLLDTAKEMILERGCRATTLQDIADRSGLTKGAIYHYVKSKDELFALILKTGMQNTDQLFWESTVQSHTGVEGPLFALSGRLSRLSNAGNVSNQIVIYLLSQKDKAAVASILKDYYETSIEMSKKWIEVGQERGGVSTDLDAKKIARMLTLIKYGLHVENIITSGENVMEDRDIFEFMRNVIGKQSG